MSKARLPQAERSRRATATPSYELVLSETDDVDDTQIQEIRMRIHDGHDAWFPASIWLLSENVDGEIRILSANPDWNEWFVTDSTPGYALRLTPQQQAVSPSLIDADRLGCHPKGF